MRYFFLPLRFLWAQKNRTRTILLLSAISIGVATLIATIISGVGKEYTRHYLPESYGPGNIAVWTKEGANPKILKQILDSPFIENASGESRPYVYDVKGSSVSGPTENGSLQYVGLDNNSQFVKNGYSLLKGKFELSNQKIVISAKYAKANDINIGQELYLPFPDKAKYYQVAGLLDDLKVKDIFEPQLILFDYKNLTSLFKKKKLDLIQIQSKQGSKEKTIKFLHKFFGTTSIIKVKQKEPIIKKTSGGLGRFFQGSAVLFIVCLLIYNAFSISAAERKRQLGILRAIGAPSKKIKRAVMAEAALLGSIGSTIGIILGITIVFFMHLLKAPITGDLAVFASPIWSIPASFLFGLGLTVISAIPAARTATKTKPLDAIFPERITAKSFLERRGHLLGIPTIILGLVGIFTLSYSGNNNMVIFGMLGVILTMLGAIFALPKYVPAMVTSIARVSNFFTGGLFRLAIFSAAKNPGRTAITVSTFLIGTSLSLGFIAIDNSLINGLIQTQTAPLKNDIYVSSNLNPKIKERFSNVKNIKTIAEINNGAVRLLNYNYKQMNQKALLVQPPEIRARTLPPSLNLIGVNAKDYLKIRSLKLISSKSVTESMLKGNNIFITKNFADQYGYKIGQKIKVIESSYWWPDASSDMKALRAIFNKTKKTKPGTTLKIAGILANDALNVDAMVDQDIANKILSQKNQQSLLIKTNKPSQITQVSKQLKQLTKDRPEIKIQTKQSEQKRLYNNSEHSPILFSLIGIVGLILFISILSVINTQSANIVERTREFGLLQAVGLTTKKIRKIIIIESFCLGIIGSVPGIIIAMLLSYIFVLGFRNQVALIQGVVPYNFPYLVALIILLLTAFSGLFAGYLAARKIGDKTIKEALTQS